MKDDDILTKVIAYAFLILVVAIAVGFLVWVAKVVWTAVVMGGCT
jgi:hypothetical protein